MKILLITGGSRGLGKNTAIKAAKKGLGVILTYNSSRDEANKVVEEIEENGGSAVALKLDVSKTNTFADFIINIKKILKEKWNMDKFHYLVNNGGFGVYASIAETTEEQFDQLMNVHLKGPFFLTQKLLPLIEDGGKIINISSGLTRFSFENYSAYAAMKGGMEVLTRYMAKELGSRGITANTIAPGAIETDFGDGFVRDNKEMNQTIASITSLGRAGLPDDIGNFIAAFLSDNTNWVNAQRIEASGGTLI